MRVYVCRVIRRLHYGKLDDDDDLLGFLMMDDDVMHPTYAKGKWKGKNGGRREKEFRQS